MAAVAGEGERLRQLLGRLEAEGRALGLDELRGVCEELRALGPSVAEGALGGEELAARLAGQLPSFTEEQQLSIVAAFAPVRADIRRRMVTAIDDLNGWLSHTPPCGANAVAGKEALASSQRLAEHLQAIDHAPQVRCYRQCEDLDVKTRFLFAVAAAVHAAQEPNLLRSHVAAHPPTLVLAQRLSSGFFTFPQHGNVLKSWLDARLQRYNKTWLRAVERAAERHREELQSRLAAAVRAAGEAGAPPGAPAGLRLAQWPMARCPLARELRAFLDERGQSLGDLGRIPLKECPVHSLQPATLLRLVRLLGQPFLVDEHDGPLGSVRLPAPPAAPAAGMATASSPMAAAAAAGVLRPAAAPASALAPVSGAASPPVRSTSAAPLAAPLPSWTTTAPSVSATSLSTIPGVSGTLVSGRAANQFATAPAPMLEPVTIAPPVVGLTGPGAAAAPPPGAGSGAPGAAAPAAPSSALPVQQPAAPAVVPPPALASPGAPQAATTVAPPLAPAQPVVVAPPPRIMAARSTVVSAPTAAGTPATSVAVAAATAGPTTPAAPVAAEQPLAAVPNGGTAAVVAPVVASASSPSSGLPEGAVAVPVPVAPAVSTAVSVQASQGSAVASAPAATAGDAAAPASGGQTAAAVAPAGGATAAVTGAASSEVQPQQGQRTVVSFQTGASAKPRATTSATVVGRGPVANPQVLGFDAPAPAKPRSLRQLGSSVETGAAAGEAAPAAGDGAPKLVRRRIDWQDLHFLERLVRRGLDGDEEWQATWQQHCADKRLTPDSIMPKDFLVEFVERHLYVLLNKEWAKDLLYKVEGQPDELPKEEAAVEEAGEAAKEHEAKIPEQPAAKEVKEAAKPAASPPASRGRRASPAGSSKSSAASGSAERAVVERQPTPKKKKSKKKKREREAPPSSSDESLGEALEPTQYHKTRMCFAFLEGRCNKDRECSFAHKESELRQAGEARSEYLSKLERRRKKQLRKESEFTDHGPYYKTQMCQPFMVGQCRNGKSCVFAHWQEELRPTPEALMQMMSMGTMMGGPMFTMPQMMGPQAPPHLPPQMRPQLALQLPPQLAAQLPPGMQMPLAEPRASGTGIDKMGKRKSEKEDKAKKKKDKEKEKDKDKDKDKEKDKEKVKEKEKHKEKDRHKEKDVEKVKKKDKKEKEKDKEKTGQTKGKKAERKVDEEDL